VKYKLQARGFELTDAIKNYLDKRLEKIDRSFKEDRIISADARFEKEKGTYRFEFTVHVPEVVIRVEERGSDLYSLMDAATDVLERKLKAYKETRMKHKRRAGRREVPAEPVEDEFEGEAPESAIVKRKRFAMKPMLLEEAIEQMKLLGHTFFVFRNADTNEVNVLYIRNDGGLGLIELSE